MARVFHAELWGPREGRDGQGGKYGWLFERDVEKTPWQELQPTSPFYLFIPQNTGLRAEYEKGWKITDIFPVNSAGIVTARDALSVHFAREELLKTVSEFASLDVEMARQRFDLGQDTRDWNVGLAQKDITTHAQADKLTVNILYRPFDVRWTCYTGQSRGFLCMPRPEVMRHMLAGANLALISARSNKSGTPDHFFCTRLIMETKCGESTTQSCLFPLYVYPPPGHHAMLKKEKDYEDWLYRNCNLAHSFVEAVAALLGLPYSPCDSDNVTALVGPEDMFRYIYAIFHCPTYRSRYAEFLKGDFPRVPLTSNRDQFRALCEKGGELVALHLLEFNESASMPDKNVWPTSWAGIPACQYPIITRFPIPGDHIVAKGYPKYVQPGRVHINAGQYFEGVPQNVWNFHVGGYQVAHKWLKDRQGRQLSYDDLTHYQKTITALYHTIRIMQEIDALIPKWPLE